VHNGVVVLLTSNIFFDGRGFGGGGEAERCILFWKIEYNEKGDSTRHDVVLE
jgi:hypothetical protein